MVAAVIQVAPDGTGKQVDAQALLNALAVLVYRQTVTVGDPNFLGNVQEVDAGGQAYIRSGTLEDLLSSILVELQVHSALLHSTLNSRDDLSALRTEIAGQPAQTTS